MLTSQDTDGTELPTITARILVDKIMDTGAGSLALAAPRIHLGVDDKFQSMEVADYPIQELPAKGRPYTGVLFGITSEVASKPMVDPLSN